MMKLRTVFKSFLITGIVLVILIISGSFVLKHYIERKIKNVSTDAVVFHTGRVRLSLLDKRLTLNDVFAEDQHFGNSVTADKLVIQGIKVLPLLLRNEVELGSVKISGAKIVTGHDLKKLFRESGSDSNKYKLKHIKALSISGSHIIYSDSVSGDTVFSAGLDVKIDHLDRNPSATRYDVKSFGFDAFYAGLQDAAYVFPDGKFRLALDTFRFDTKSQLFTIRNMAFQSLFGRYEMGPETGNESDWYDLKHLDIEMTGLNTLHFFKDSTLFVRTATMANGDLLIAKDKRYPLGDRPDKELPASLFAELPYKICFDSFRIRNVDIDYYELHEGRDTAGCITFHNLQAEFENFSNIDSTINGPTRILAQASLMDDAVLYADIQFPNIAVNAENQCKGYLHNMDMTTFNRILEYQTPVTIEGGKIDTLRLSFTYNSDVSIGEMNFQYHGFDIKISRRENILTRLLHTFRIPDLVLADENQKRDESFNKGEIHAERNKKRSIFNFWAGSVISGMKSTLNLPQ
ncbi:hypothetical protein [Saccharicrinis sp. FJH54]|uniref:hypothetical protein n=1 Tax=Saccharicrinis sp. FJH54 TaxID=3344665 RepID=UPI0035D4E9A1